MADFETAFRCTDKAEGGYADDPDDSGGETFRGIARNFHPGWSGWARIDEIKRTLVRVRWNAEMRLATADQVEAFYRTFYWHPIQGDALPDQDVANILYDAAVNQGTHPAACFLQEALNLLNRNGSDYLDLVVDGKIGPRTLAALQVHLRGEKSPALLLKVVGFLRMEQWVNLMRRKPSQEKFARSWLARI